MNLLLHGITADFRLGDTLGDVGLALPRPDIVLTNPPFGTKKGGQPSRDDLPYPTSNKQFAFLQHIIMTLKPGGRAAVIFPDNILFENGKGTETRRYLMQQCNLHTILKLPTGLFYSPGVKTNVLFFTKVSKTVKATTDVWVYDLRSGAPAFGRTRRFEREQLSDFEKCYGDDPYGRSARLDQGEKGRFRRYTREQIAVRGDSLDMSWLNPATLDDAAPGAPRAFVLNAMTALRLALDELELIADRLESSHRVGGR
jgi:type I restriction enzyme M protein